MVFNINTNMWTKEFKGNMTHVLYYSIKIDHKLTYEYLILLIYNFLYETIKNTDNSS